MQSKRLRLRYPLLASFIALFTFASACLNDRDTLADEARKNRDVLTTLVGGFERNPPLYYEMRIDRIKNDLAKNSKLIGEYDDIAVAYDRVGKDDDAIKWIEAKKKQLAPLDMKNEESKDVWYRYYANCGTFWVHRWAHNGANAKQIKEVEHGRDLIQKALEINPNAHFGREKYQLVVIKWLIECQKLGPSPLAWFLQDPSSRVRNGLDDESHPSFGWLSIAQQKEAITGLSGLIRLGGAWQSPDVYIAIGSLFLNEKSYRPNPLSTVAFLRAKEILDSGGKSMNPDFTTIDAELYRVKNVNYLNASEMGEYRRLRELADKWHDDREAFMMAKLKRGDHPDIDPHFWDGAPPTPSFEVHQSVWTYLTAKVFTPSNLMYLVCPGLPILLFLWISVRILKRSARKRA